MRKTSRRHGIHTDASHRFERGADFESTVLSCDLVAELILQSGGGELVGDTIDVMSRKIDQAPVVLRISEVQRISGGIWIRVKIFPHPEEARIRVIPEGKRMRSFACRFPVGGWMWSAKSM